MQIFFSSIYNESDHKVHIIFYLHTYKFLYQIRN